MTLVLTVGAIWLTARGVRLSTAAVRLAVLVQVAIMLAVCIAVLVDQKTRLSSTPFAWSQLAGLPGLSAGFPLPLYMFIGWENGPALAEETRNPGRTILIALCVSIAITAALFVLFAYATVTGFHYDVSSVGRASVPFLSVADRYLGGPAMLAWRGGDRGAPAADRGGEPTSTPSSSSWARRRSRRRRRLTGRSPVAVLWRRCTASRSPSRRTSTCSARRARYYDPATSEPVLLSVKHGLLGRQVALIPAAEAVLSRDYVRVPYSAAQIERAQRARVEDELSGEQIAAVGALFGVALPSTGPLYSSERDRAAACRGRRSSPACAGARTRGGATQRGGRGGPRASRRGR